MIELLLTCFLHGLFTPPQGWTITELFALDPNKSSSTIITIYCEGGCPRPRPYVKLKRVMQQGEVIDVPEGCTVQADAKALMGERGTLELKPQQIPDLRWK